MMDRRGVIAVMFALMLPFLVGLGVEVGYWFQHRRDVQTLADAAAIAGAYEAMDSSATTTTVTTAATADASRNGFSVTTDTIAVAYPPSSGTYSSDATAVNVSVSRTVQLLFSSWFLGTSVTVSASATANSAPSGNEACVLALSSTASGAVSVSGTASVSLDGCQVATNSSHAKSVDVSNNADLTTDCITTVGDIDGSPTYSVCSSASTNASTITDPYSSLAVPTDVAAHGCDYSGSGNSAYSPADGETISVNPADDYAVICNGLTVNSGDTITFDAGTYVIDEGTFKINGGAFVTGTDVTIILTASDGSGYADVSIAGGSTMSLSAPTSGDYSGILFFQDSNAPSSPSSSFDFTGGSNTELTGVIYVPNNDVNFNGGNSTDDNGCLQIVANTVTFNGNADLENQCTGLGLNTIYTSYAVSLVE